MLYLPSPCAVSLAGIPPGGPGLSGLVVHEKAHTGISINLSNLLLNALYAGRIDCLLVQLVLPVYNAIRKVYSTVPRAPNLTNLSE